MAKKQELYKELYDLDPSSRVERVDLCVDQNKKDQAIKIFDSIKDDIFYAKLRQIIWKEICARNVVSNDADIEEQITMLFEENGFKKMLRNITINIYEKSTVLQMNKSTLVPCKSFARSSSDETISYIRQARMEWESGINDELNAIVGELRRPYVLVRQSGSGNPFLADEEGQFDANEMMVPEAPGGKGQESIKFLFNGEDLLEAGLAIKCNNIVPSTVSGMEPLELYMGILRLHLKTPTLEELMERYSELSCLQSQLGSDENTYSLGGKINVMRHEEGEIIVEGGEAIPARRYIRRGCPPSLRPKIWRLALGLCETPVPTEVATFRRLQRECHRLDLLTDHLFLHDIQTVTDDPRFFVFEDELKQVVFCLARDDWIRENSTYEIHKPIFADATKSSGVSNSSSSSSSSGGKGSNDGDANEATGSNLAAHDGLQPGSSFPPCGFQPFLGLCSYFAPLGYLYRDLPSLYSVCRSIYCKLWCKLNVLSSCSDTLLTVCKTFESLLIHMNGSLFLHLVNIGLQPLKIAYPWIQLGFVQLLEIDQILILWDRMIGYMDPTILAVAAVAIFIHRSEALFRSRSELEANSVLSEGSRLKVIPLIQMVLLREPRQGSSSSGGGH